MVSGVKDQLMKSGLKVSLFPFFVSIHFVRFFQFMPVFLKHHFNHIEDLYEKPAMQILQTLHLARAAKILRCFSALFKTAVLHCRPKTHPIGAKVSFAYCKFQMYPSLK